MAPAAPYTRLKITSLKFISLVDHGAQGEVSNVVLAKRSPSGHDDITVCCKVAATDTKLGIVFGWALASTLDGGKTPHIDHQRDHVVGGDDLIKIAAEFAEQGAQSDVMHDGSADGRVLFMLPLTANVLKALGMRSDVEGLAIGMKPSAEAFARYEKGELNAFSIAGTGIREVVKADDKPACPGCGAYGKADDATCAKCGKAMKRAPVGKMNDNHDDHGRFAEGSGGGSSGAGSQAPSKLTETQFSSAQDKIDGLARSTRRGTPEEKTAFTTLNTEWEAANALPQRTAADRDKRFAEIASVAHRHGLIAKRAPVVKSTWTTADIDGLPDSSFLYVEGGGKTDSDGKTTPRSLRHFPYRDATGKIDLPHLRDAIGRIPQSSLPKDRRDALQVKAEKLLGKQHDAAKRFAKQATLTGSVDGHQHSLDLDDPADEWRDTLSTSYQTSEGADQSHCHAWTFDATTGKITIADDSGHTHPVEDIVPDDVRAQAALQESGERCPKCAAMSDEGCRYCPACGASMDRRDGVPDCAASDDDSGPSVVIVAARAPESPPSGGANTVKSATKEPIAMPDLNDKIKELEASNARLSKLASLTDAQRAHHGKLSGTDAETFLAKSTHERDVVLSDIAKADEVVYKSPHTGREFRKSHPLEMIEMAKQLDEATTVAKSSAARETEMTFAKRGDETLGGFAKGAKGNLRGRIMKALNAEFTDPAEYEEAVKAMKSANAAFKDLGVARGGIPDGEPGDASPKAQLDAMVAKRAADKGEPNHKAFAAVLETAEGAALYSQIPVGRA